MKLTFLGTGGAFTDFRVNYHNNALITVAPNRHVLIDCGGTAVQSLKELEIPVSEVNDVIITHMHGDHVGGLEQLIWERTYTPPFFRHTNVYTPSNLVKDLTQFLDPMLRDFNGPDGNPRTDWEGTLATIHGQNRIRVGDGSFRLVPVPHVIGKNSYGVLIRNGNEDYFFTSDALFDPTCQMWNNVCDPTIVFHDCTFGKKYPGTVHTHYEDLVTLPAEEKIRIVLMHHTSVPDGIDPVADGFLGVADRHSVFEI